MVDISQIRFGPSPQQVLTSQLDQQESRRVVQGVIPLVLGH